MSDVISVFSFPIGILDKPKGCAWKPKDDDSYKCQNDVSHGVIEPSPQKDVKRIIEVLLGYYCQVHYSDVFPNLAREEGIYN